MEKDNLFARWLGGDLSPQEEVELQSSGELEELEAIIKAADNLALPKYDTEAGYAQFKANNSEEKTTKLRSLNTRRLWSILAVAASILFIIYAGNLFLNGPNTIETANKMTFSHQFEDLTSVVLNDGSKLVYSAANWQTQRSVELTGEAVFTVQKGIPFIVYTPNGIIEVLGTSFNVRAWGEKLYVECYEGQVRVRSNNQETILSQNQAVNVKNGQMENTTITHQKPLWTSGSSRFYGEDLNHVFAELERQFDVKVKAPKFNQPFSGNFKHVNLETALNEICKPMGLTYTISDNGKLVTLEE